MNRSILPRLAAAIACLAALPAAAQKGAADYFNRIVSIVAEKPTIKRG